jgi:TRAP transporter TAXI family solute receptor
MLRLLMVPAIAVLALGGAATAGLAQEGARPVVRFLDAGGYTTEFVKEWAKAVPTVHLKGVASHRIVSTRLEEIQFGEADLVINLSRTAYLAYSGQLDPKLRFEKLRAISALGVVPIHLVARADSGIRSVKDLRGRRVNVGPPVGELFRVSGALFAQFGFDVSAVRAFELSFDAAATELRAGRLDAMFVVGAYPAAAVTDAMADGRAYLVPIEGAYADHLRFNSSFLHPALIPAGTYPGQGASVRTIGMQNILVCARDLDEQTVYELTKYLFVALPKLSAIVSSVRLMNIDQASATSVPLHDGAARYYRERELAR